jgi:predicted nucleic acid-binding protein
MLVVDTNVLAFLLIAGEHTEQARALLEQDADWRSESFIMVELSNVLATTMRVRGMTRAQAGLVLAQAQELMEPGLHLVQHADALALAIEFKVSAYDARFLAVARSLGQRLVTEDRKLQEAAPALTQSIAEALQVD